MNAMLEAALDYISKGYSIIPLKYKDKKPLMKWAEFQNRIATPEECKEWFMVNKMNIGIVTGEISKISVLDIDGPEALKLAKSKGLPETRLIKTGKAGGWHCYYQYEPGLRNWQARTDLPGIDIRSDGGYVVAPPSIHPNGSQYKVVKDLELGAIPVWVLNNSSSSFSSFTSLKDKSIYINTNNISTNGDSLQNLQNLQNLFDGGRRDIDLFHVANAMVKGGLELPYIRECLKRLINSWGENDPKWIEDKISSALKRDDRKQESIIGELKDFFSLTETYITLTETLQTLQNLQGNKNAVYQAMHRLVKEGFLEKHPTKFGTYRMIQKDFELMNYKASKGKQFEVLFPLDIDNFAILYPGNIVLLAGSKNSGKTTFLLNFIKMNQDRHKILYMNSEMGEDELNARLELFQDMKLDDWKFDAIDRKANYHDPINPDKYSIFIIDYLEVLENFFEVGKPIQAIHNKLGKSICVIAIQKKKDAEFGRGGEFSLEKARLGLNLDRGKIKISVCKSWVKGWENPNGKVKEFKIIDGSKILPTTMWGYEGERKKLSLRREPGED
jgi:hypothetical protein